MRLTVHQLPRDETYLDIARIPEGYRLDRSNQPIEEGVVCSLQCNGAEVFVIARGSTRTDASIMLDARTRNLLNVTSQETYDFQMSKADFFGQVRWAKRASDIRYSFPVQIAILSLVLGVIGLVVGIISVLMAGYSKVAGLLFVGFAVVFMVWSAPGLREKCFEKRRKIVAFGAAVVILVLGAELCWTHPGVVVRVIDAAHLPAPKILLHRDSERDLELSTASAEAGDAKAQFELFDFLSGTPDSWKGEQWLRRSAELGYDKAEVEMGDRAKDVGDLVGAFAWYRKASLQGHAAKADDQLGWAYLTGKVVPKDCWKAHFFLEDAARKGGMESAAMDLSWLYSGGSSCEEFRRQDPVQACKWLLIAHALGNDSTCDSKVQANLSYSQVQEAKREAQSFLDSNGAFYHWKPKHPDWATAP